MKRFFKIVAVLLVTVFLLFAFLFALKAEYPVKYEVCVTKYAKEFGTDENLIYAIIKAESKFKEDAISSKNAVGLMQITEPTAAWIAEKLNMDTFSPEMLKIPEVNIRMGAFYISYLLDMYQGDKKCALSAYNAGHRNVDTWLLNKDYSKDGKTLSVIPFPETERYVNKVICGEKIYGYLNR